MMNSIVPIAVLFVLAVALKEVQAFVPVSPARPSTQQLQVSSLRIEFSNAANNTSDANDVVVGNGNVMSADALPPSMLELPRHPHEGVNEILIETEHLLRSVHTHSKKVDVKNIQRSSPGTGGAHDAIFANTYVDLGKVDTVGFDYDYTLVTYTDELLELIYDMALKRLVHDRFYPAEMLEAGLKFDSYFSIRGLAVDKGKTKEDDAILCGVNCRKTEVHPPFFVFSLLSTSINNNNNNNIIIRNWMDMPSQLHAQGRRRLGGPREGLIVTNLQGIPRKAGINADPTTKSLKTIERSFQYGGMLFDCGCDSIFQRVRTRFLSQQCR
jgi:hypothetical protein